MTQGFYKVIIILPIKSKMASAKKQCFFFLLRFMYLTYTKTLGTNVASLLWLHWSPVLLYVNFQYSETAM